MPAPRSLDRRRDDATAVMEAGKRSSPGRRHTATGHALARTLALALAALLFPELASALDEITFVSAPSESLVAGASHAVTWVYATDDEVSGTTGDLNPFSIELRSCVGDAEQQASCGSGETCGNPYRALCSLETGASCMDSDGSYDVTIPEDVDSGVYVFSVTYLGASGWSSAASDATGLVSGCSESFLVEEAPASSAAALTATAPAALEPGDPFTAQWAYDDGSGQTGGSFEVNLYSCADAACANDSCGTFISALCGDGGCYDPGPGDYDVRVPATAAAGKFKLQVKSAVTSDTNAAVAETCTDAFDVTEPANNNNNNNNVVISTQPTPSPVVPPVAVVAATAAPLTPALVEDALTASPVPTPTAAPVPDPTAAPVPAPTAAPAPAPTAAPVPDPTAAPVAAADAVTPVATGGTTSSSDGNGNTPGTPPTPVPPRVTCNPAAEVEFTYAVESTTLQPLIKISHASENRDDGGCTNFSALYEWLQTKPAQVPENLLYPVNPNTNVVDTSGGPATGVWLLRTSVDIENGVLMEVMGTQTAGGDADKVLISSNPLVLRIRGTGGHLYFYETHVTSWVEALGAPHELPADSDGSEPRSYVGCLSEILEAGQTCDGVAQKQRGECRMDMIKSEIAYLGYDATESYGITWKVRGLCKDLSNRDTLFESVRVYGDIDDCDIHHLWYGHYSYGHLGGVWTNNLMHDNHVYGFDPHDDSDYLTISGNSCYDNGDHGIIASKRCDHLLVENNDSSNNGGSGIMLHQACDDSIVRDNVLQNNVDAGISLVETSRTSVSGNAMNNNKYGIRVLVGSNDNLVSLNDFESNTQNDIYLYIGSALDEVTVPGNTGINMRNTFDDNTVISTTKFPLDVEDSDETAIINNSFFGDGAFKFINSSNTRLSANTGDPADAIPFLESSCFAPNSADAKAQIVVATPAISKEAGQDFSTAFSYSGSGGTTGDLIAYDIELRTHSSDTATTGCGEDVFASLCTEEVAEDASLVCMDSDGSYDVQIPDDAPAGKYSIKIMLSEDNTVWGCTDAFDVTRPTTQDGSDPVVVVAGEPHVEEVESPGAMSPGKPFTARWVYDDGAGRGEGTFEVNLNACSDDGDCGDGGCGTFSTALCGDAGCSDPGTGDFDVLIPADLPLGDYKLEVVSTSDTNVKRCSDAPFSVMEEADLPDESADDGPATPAPSPPPLPTFAPFAPTAPPSTPPVAAPVAAPVASPVDSSPGEPGSPGTPPSPVPAMVECDPTAELEFTYTLETTKRPLVTVSHASGDRSESGCLTLTKLYDWLATGPPDVPTGMLLTVNPATETADTSATASPTGVWLLDTSVEVTNGVTFEIKGTAIGGDCDELKFSSTVKKWNRIMGHGGNIDIGSTYIRSWDATKTLDHIFKDGADGKSPRSFISCVSEVLFPGETCDGTAQKDMGVCRMDIMDSTLAYLGFDDTESYGITWKVRGLCDDLSNVDTLFESVRVYGDMKNSDIYGMWYGHYSYGHLGGVWTNNLMHDNHVYGFDPHDDSDYLTISGNTCYNNGNHGIIASKRCDHLLVENNESYDNDGSGIMLHKSCDDSVVRGNEAYGNFDAGLSLVETSRCSVAENNFEDNRWGLRIILGSSDNVFDSNILTENTNSDIYSYYGAAEEVPEVSPFTGINTNNVYSNNAVTHLVKTTVDIEDSDSTELSGNTFSGNDNGAHFVFLRSTNTHVVDNTGDAANGELDDITDSCFTPESDRLPLC
eukprot:g9457.t1